MNLKNNILIILGAPGSGKGTISNKLVANFDFKKISTGDLCRKIINNKNHEFNILTTETIKKGNLVPDEIIIKILKDYLISLNFEVSNKFIFDGYPRNLAQAELLYNLIKTDFSNYEINIVKIVIDSSVIIKRLLNRIICGNIDCQKIYSLEKNSPYKSKYDTICDSCDFVLKNRIDDTKESILSRIDLYNKNEADIINFYNKKNLKINSIDGNRSLDEIFNDLKVLFINK